MVGQMNGELQRMSMLITETQMVTGKQTKERAVSRFTTGTVETMSMETGEPGQKPKREQAGMVRTPKPQVLRRQQTLLPHRRRRPPRQRPRLPASMIQRLSLMPSLPSWRPLRICRSALGKQVRVPYLLGFIRSGGDR